MLTRGRHDTILTSTCQDFIVQRVKLDHFVYLKGKIVPNVSLWCPVVQCGYLKGKIESLPISFYNQVETFTLQEIEY